MDWPSLPLYISTLALSLLFVVSALYGFSRLIKNAGMIDIFWGASFGIVAVVLYLLFLQSGNSGKLVNPWDITAPAFLFTVMVGLSSLRLAWHIARRFAHEFPTEDVRYTGLRANWPAHPELYMWLIFVFQGALITLLSMPFYAVYDVPQAQHSVFSVAAFFLWNSGVLIEAQADAQLFRFKRHQKNQKTTASGEKPILNTGLWGRSQHPNYFGQWLTWLSFSLFIIAINPSPLAYFSVSQPLIMYFMLTRLSGIPITEEHMERTRGEAFKQYKKTTPAFFPKLF